MKFVIRLTAAVLLIVTAFTLGSCAKEEGEAPDGFVLAENEGADYLFYYPSNWLLDRCDAGMTSAVCSETDFSNVSVTAFTASAEVQTLVDYIDKYYFAQFEDNFRNLTVEKNQDGSTKRTAVQIDGHESFFVQYRATFAGEAYRFRAYLVSENGYIYTILYTAKEALFENHLQEAAAMAENLRFR